MVSRMANDQLDVAAKEVETAVARLKLARSTSTTSWDGAENDALVEQLEAVTGAVQAILEHLRTDR